MCLWEDLESERQEDLEKAPDAETAAEMVRKLQEEKYGGGVFTTADKIR